MAQSPTAERIMEALESQHLVIRHNLQQVLRCLLWPLVLEAEHGDKHGGRLGQDIDTVVRTVMNTSRYDAHECVVWDQEEALQALANLRAALAEKGIE